MGMVSFQRLFSCHTTSTWWKSLLQQNYCMEVCGSLLLKRYVAIAFPPCWRNRNYVSIESIKTVQGQIANHEFCINLLELLQANIDQVVEVQLDGKEWIIGRIDSVLPVCESEPPRGMIVLDVGSSKHVFNSTRVTVVKMPLHPPTGRCPIASPSSSNSLFELLSEEMKGSDQQLQTRLVKNTPTTNLRITYSVKVSGSRVNLCLTQHTRRRRRITKSAQGC